MPSWEGRGGGEDENVITPGPNKDRWYEMSIG